MKHNFIIRLYNYQRTHTLGDINNITISNITLISKPHKKGLCYHNGNKKKFGYTIELDKEFLDWAGSHNHPILAFKGEYIDIIIKDFPRYPVFCQEMSAARSNLTGYGYTNYMNEGFPICLLYRNIEIIFT
jgi:hypothetical protein